MWSKINAFLSHPYVMFTFMVLMALFAVRDLYVLITVGFTVGVFMYFVFNTVLAALNYYNWRNARRMHQARKYGVPYIR